MTTRGVVTPRIPVGVSADRQIQVQVEEPELTSVGHQEGGSAALALDHLECLGWCGAAPTNPTKGAAPAKLAHPPEGRSAMSTMMLLRKGASTSNLAATTGPGSTGAWKGMLPTQGGGGGFPTPAGPGKCARLPGEQDERSVARQVVLDKPSLSDSEPSGGRPPMHPVPMKRPVPQSSYEILDESSMKAFIARGSAWEVHDAQEEVRLRRWAAMRARRVPARFRLGGVIAVD